MTSSGLRKDRRTPGVYVTEFPAFPPTIYGVNTAIPCFIGYTERATDPVTKKDLTNKPVPILSMTEYIATFGGGIKQIGMFCLTAVKDDDNFDFKAISGQLITVNTENTENTELKLDSSLACSVGPSGTAPGPEYKLYPSMQMFYANGGGYCYVISAGAYGSPIESKALINGLMAAESLQDVTMLVIPDACQLEEEDYGTVATAMLNQAGQTGNRVAILDLPDCCQAKTNEDLKQKQTTFNVKIGAAQEYFSYGAAYAPALQSSLFSTQDLDYRILKESENSHLINHLLTSQALAQYLSATPSDCTKLNEVIGQIAQAFPAIEATELKPDKYNTITMADGTVIEVKADQSKNPLAKCEGLALWDASSIDTIKSKVCVSKSETQSTSMTSPGTLEKYLNNAIPLLKRIEKLVLNHFINVVPPSGVMAGVWTKSDAINGVWNAPANIYLNMVEAPLVLINDQEQEDYNIPAFGESICILRSFVGRGTVVWGARTLDGNSNDFRYIQVRRTLIYVEQSIKLAMRAFVFAANDAKTWTTVVAMISNFLNNLWQAGGLMGTKPEEAFSVACGVPTTMTGLDVLNGYMIVNVSLQMVHPAEFIELTFTQRMQGV